MMICAGHQNKEIIVAVQCSLNTVKTIRHELWLDESNITGDLIAFVQQKSSKICRKGIRLNSDAYMELVNTVVKSWITRVANGRPYVWQQDSALGFGEFLRLH